MSETSQAVQNKERTLLPINTDSNESERSMKFVVSTEDPAHDRGVVLTAGGDLSQYVVNSPVLWSHDRFAPPVAHSMWVRKDGTKIVAKDRFANTDDGEQFRILYRDGVLNAVSLGFSIPTMNDISEPTEDELRMHKDWKGKVDWVCRKWVMTEHSFCNIPALDQALAIRSTGECVAIRSAVEKGTVKRDFVLKYFGERAMEEHKDSGWEETNTSFRYRVHHPDEYEKQSFKTKTVEQGPPPVKCVMAKRTDTGVMEIQSVIFPTGRDGGWTKSGAMQWMKDHDEMVRNGGEIGHCEVSSNHERAEEEQPAPAPDPPPVCRESESAPSVADATAAQTSSRSVIVIPAPTIRVDPTVLTRADIADIVREECKLIPSIIRSAVADVYARRTGRVLR